MPYLRMVSKYRTLTGLERDVQTNTLHFAYNGDREDAASDIASAWALFVLRIDQYMSDDIFDPDVDMDFFDMAEPEPRVPFFSSTVGATYVAEDSLPLECSFVVSFAGPIVSGPGAGRKRGRIYLPTFTKDTIVSGGGGIAWEGTMRADVADAFKDFGDSLLALASPIALQVFSPTTLAGGGTLAASMTAVTRGWIDSEPDTQRRRSHHQGTKTQFVIA